MRYGPGAALVVVDMQVDFGSPDGGLYVAGGEQTIAVVNEEIATAVGAGSPVFYTRDWHPPVTPHFAKDGGIWPVHCVAGTPGAELLPGLHIQGTLVHKGITGEDGYSGFMVRDPESGETGPTELDELLQQQDITRIIVVGLAGDYCVKETALDGVRLGYDVTVPLEATRFVNLQPGDDDQSVADMAAAGVRIEGELPTAA
ncbi:MAG TPA: isochorismatase family protein [Actinomycetes bacterium]|nr:isochorismatase family protein [Actinomycetes bacterium]